MNTTTNLTVEQVEAAIATTIARSATMPALLSLAPEQRQKRKRNPKLLRTTEARLEAARRHRDALPAKFDLRRFEREVALAAALERWLKLLNGISLQVQDTLQVVATRNFNSSAEAFAYIKVASAAGPGLNRTVEELKRRRAATLVRPPQAPSGLAVEVMTKPDAKPELASLPEVKAV